MLSEFFTDGDDMKGNGVRNVTEEHEDTGYYEDARGVTIELSCSCTHDSHHGGNEAGSI